jgi:hypothetical protein
MAAGVPYLIAVVLIIGLLAVRAAASVRRDRDERGDGE